MTSPPVFLPRTLDDAVGTLADYDGTAKVVAGSTALTLLMNQGLVAPQALVSLARLEGLDRIDAADGVLRFGAAVVHETAARTAAVRASAPALAESFAVVGNARIRAAATVGGVMAEADYASDPPASLLLLDGWVVAHGQNGPRRIDAEDLFVGFYETSLGEAEILTEVAVPVVPHHTGTAYLKYSSRSADDRPCVGVAALVRSAPDGRCIDLRVSVGAATERPFRLREVERAALGSHLDDAAVSVAESYAEAIDPITDIRGSAWYRTEMTRVWVERALRVAATRGSANTPLSGEHA